MERKSGVLLHISSLNSGYSIGSLGRGARDFCDLISECGFSVWQVLPLCITDSYNSPYTSYASFIENPYFLDLETLYKKGLITEDELMSSREASPYLCEFERLKEQRIPLLKRAAKRAYQNKELRSLIEKRAENKTEVKNSAVFLAKKEKAKSIPWQKWRDVEYDGDDYFFYLFVSYEFYAEWCELRDYAHSRGIKIIGDIPIYLSLDSADVYYNRDKFLLDEKGYPTHVAGVPPDYFCSEGQLWNNPLYNYDAMDKDGYSFIISRIKHAFEYLDGVRLDHFRGYEAYYAIPSGSSSAKDGEWRCGPGRALIDKIKAASGEKLIIAEDLGDITDEVRELLSYSDFPGMRVLQFGFMSEDSCHLPHNYEKNSVAFTGTHDNNTLLGFVYEMNDADRRRTFDYAGYYGNDLNEGAWALFCSVLRSASDTAIFPIQDILLYGCDTRMNTPGVAEGNWAYRVTREQLDSIDRGRLLYFNRLYGRR